MLHIIDEKNEKTLREKVLKMSFPVKLITNYSFQRFFCKFVTTKLILTTQKHYILCLKEFTNYPK